MRRVRKHLSASWLVAIVALFAAMGGTRAIAAPVAFMLNAANAGSSQTTLNAPVAGRALQVTNTNTAAGATALGLNVAAGHAPLTTNSVALVKNLNADTLDGVDSATLLPSGSPLSVSRGGAAPVIHGTNAAAGPGVQGNSAAGNGVTGVTPAATSSGVYGENDGGGYGVAGRAANGGLAGWFDGDVLVSGNLDVAGSTDVDATSLGGVSASDLAHGTLVHGAADYALGDSGTFLTTAGPRYDLFFACQSNATGGVLDFTNNSGGPVNFFISIPGSPFPIDYEQIDDHGGWSYYWYTSGAHATIQVEGSSGTTTFHVFALDHPADCHVQADGWISG